MIWIKRSPVNSTPQRPFGLVLQPPQRSVRHGRALAPDARPQAQLHG
jgi:hypothetical protein